MHGIYINSLTIYCVPVITPKIPRKNFYGIYHKRSSLGCWITHWKSPLFFFFYFSINFLLIQKGGYLVTGLRVVIMHETKYSFWTERLMDIKPGPDLRWTRGHGCQYAIICCAWNIPTNPCPAKLFFTLTFKKSLITWY